MDDFLLVVCIICEGVEDDSKLNEQKVKFIILMKRYLILVSFLRLISVFRLLLYFLINGLMVDNLISVLKFVRSFI